VGGPRLKPWVINSTLIRKDFSASLCSRAKRLRQQPGLSGGQGILESLHGVAPHGLPELGIDFVGDGHDAEEESAEVEQLRLFCRVWKMLTCSSRDSSTIMAAV